MQTPHQGNFSALYSPFMDQHSVPDAKHCVSLILKHCMLNKFIQLTTFEFRILPLQIPKALRTLHSLSNCLFFGLLLIHITFLWVSPANSGHPRVGGSLRGKRKKEVWGELSKRKSQGLALPVNQNSILIHSVCKVQSTRTFSTFFSVDFSKITVTSRERRKTPLSHPKILGPCSWVYRELNTWQMGVWPPWMITCNWAWVNPFWTSPIDHQRGWVIFSG